MLEGCWTVVGKEEGGLGERGLNKNPKHFWRIMNFSWNISLKKNKAFYYDVPGKSTTSAVPYEVD